MAKKTDDEDTTFLAQDTPDETPVEEDARPEWLPEQFKAPEDLARSYGELQKKLGEQGSELSSLRDGYDELIAQVEQNVQQPQQQGGGIDGNPLVQAYEQAFNNGDVAGMLAITAQISEAVAQSHAPPPDNRALEAITGLAEQQFAAQTPEYDQYRERVYELVRENPGLIASRDTVEGVTRGLNYAFSIARGETLAQQQATQAEKDAQAENGRQAKLAAQTVPGGGNRPPAPDEQKDLWDKIMNAGSGGFRLPA